MKVLDELIPPTVWNFLDVGFMAALVILLGKVIFTRVQLPGVSEFFAAL